MILRELLSISSEFEGGSRRPGDEPPSLAALRVLAGLEAVARTSLSHRIAMAQAPVPPRSSALPVPDRIAIPPAPSSPSLWSTRSKAYRPALGDPSVIEALLKFRDQAPPFEEPTSKPVTPRTPVAQPAPQPRHEIVSPEIHPARMERLSAKDLEPCFPLAPSSNLLRPRQ